jgi:hypothetical protein
MKKAEALKHWDRLPENLPIMPHFTPLPYKAKGSTYGACGIRIDGTPEFIDAVMSRLKDLMEAENETTRLSLARTPVDGATLGKTFANKETQAEVCYIRRATRGHEAQIMASRYGITR